MRYSFVNHHPHLRNKFAAAEDVESVLGTGKGPVDTVLDIEKANFLVLIRPNQDKNYSFVLLTLVQVHSISLESGSLLGDGGL